MTIYRDEAKDVIFYDEDCSKVALENRMFAILFPYDAHMPGLHDGKSESVKKAVIKVKV